MEDNKMTRYTFTETCRLFRAFLKDLGQLFTRTGWTTCKAVYVAIKEIFRFSAGLFINALMFIYLLFLLVYNGIGDGLEYCRKSKALTYSLFAVVLMVSIATYANTIDREPHECVCSETLDENLNNEQIIDPQTAFLFQEYKYLRKDLHDEIEAYLSSVVKNHGLNIYNIIDLCVDSGYDISFLLAQAQLESHFGTLGEAVQTKSMFNVINKQFTDKNQSVAPYISLIQRRYLTDTRTYEDLLGNYVDKHGRRYAEDASYEPKLKTIYNKITTKTQIPSLYDRLTTMKEIASV